MRTLLSARSEATTRASRLFGTEHTSAQVRFTLRHGHLTRVPLRAHPLTVQAPPANPLAAESKNWVDAVDVDGCRLTAVRSRVVDLDHPGTVSTLSASPGAL